MKGSAQEHPFKNSPTKTPQKTDFKAKPPEMLKREHSTFGP
jgi:hypothetical protein